MSRALANKVPARSGEVGPRSRQAPERKRPLTFDAERQERKAIGGDNHDGSGARERLARQHPRNPSSNHDRVPRQRHSEFGDRAAPRHRANTPSTPTTPRTSTAAMTSIVRCGASGRTRGAAGGAERSPRSHGGAPCQDARRARSASLSSPPSTRPATARIARKGPASRSAEGPYCPARVISASRSLDPDAARDGPRRRLRGARTRARRDARAATRARRSKQGPRA